MARKKRVWYPGATYHVMSRGNRRNAIFADRSDYLRFLEYLLKIREKHSFILHSLCLMTNHFHIAIETVDDELWKIMQKILSLYAEEYNHKYHFTGHLFEGRYVAQLIEDDKYFLEVSRYIHLNPVKAQMVRGPLDYEYSSYGIFMERENETGGKTGNEPFHFKKSKSTELIRELVSTERVLGAFGHDRREQYRMFVEGKISHAEQELLIMKDMKEDEMWLPW